jgi:hypothetical protein
MLIYFMVIWKILRTSGVFNDIWYILCSFGSFFPVFGNKDNKKSGNPGREQLPTKQMIMELARV